jgi:hypothetical protein
MGAVDAKRVWAGWFPDRWEGPEPPQAVDYPKAGIRPIGERDTPVLAILSGFRGNITPGSSLGPGTPSALPAGAFTPAQGMTSRMAVLVLRSDPPPPMLPRPRPGEAILVASLAAAEDAELAARREFDQFVRDRCSQFLISGLIESFKAMVTGVGIRCAIMPAPFHDDWP